jgi:inhibitor of KinA sporulation pathway (predicted exonuclease)
MECTCFPPSAFCFLPSADCLPRLQPTAYCIWGEFDLSGLLPRCAAYDKMSPPAGKERTSNFKTEGTMREYL